MTGTGQCVPVHTIVGNHHTSRFGVADKGVAVNDEVNAVLVVRIVLNGIVAHVELNITAGHAERNTDGGIAIQELDAVAAGLDIRIVRVKVAPAEAVGAGKLANREVAADVCRELIRTGGFCVTRAGYSICNRVVQLSRDLDGCCLCAYKIGGVIVASVKRCQRCTVHLDGVLIARPKQELLGDKCGVIHTDNGTGCAAPRDFDGFAFSDADCIVRAACRNAHAQNAHKHCDNQK